MKKSMIFAISGLAISVIAVTGVAFGAGGGIQKEIKAAIAQGEDTIVINDACFEVGTDISGTIDVVSANGKTYSFGMKSLANKNL